MLHTYVILGFVLGAVIHVTAITINKLTNNIAWILNSSSKLNSLISLPLLKIE